MHIIENDETFNRSFDYVSLRARLLGHFIEEIWKAKFKEENEDKTEDSKIMHSAESLPNWISFIIFGPGWNFDKSEKNIKNDRNTNSGKRLLIKKCIQFVVRVGCTFVARGSIQRR